MVEFTTLPTLWHHGGQWALLVQFPMELKEDVQWWQTNCSLCCGPLGWLRDRACKLRPLHDDDVKAMCLWWHTKKKWACSEAEWRTEEGRQQPFSTERKREDNGSPNILDSFSHFFWNNWLNCVRKVHASTWNKLSLGQWSWEWKSQTDRWAGKQTETDGLRGTITTTMMKTD